MQRLLCAILDNVFCFLHFYLDIDVYYTSSIKIVATYRAGFRGPREAGPKDSHQQGTSHQTASTLFLANDRCLRDCCSCRALLIIVRLNLSWALASHQLNLAGNLYCKLLIV